LAAAVSTSEQVDLDLRNPESLKELKELKIKLNSPSHLSLAPSPLYDNISGWEAELAKLDINASEVKWFLDAIRNGVNINYIGDHNIKQLCANLPSAFGIENENKIKYEMSAEVAKGRRAGPFSKVPFPNYVCHPIGTVPKKGTTDIRVIHHLSYPLGNSVNTFIKQFGCKLATFDQAVASIVKLGRGAYMCKLDITAAFRLIRVRKEDQHLLGLCFLGLYYYERCLPFGLASAPELFEKFSTVVQLMLTTLGIDHVHHFIDDFWLAAAALSTCTFNFQRTINLFKKLGIPLSAGKMFPPCQVLEFLGLIIDSKSWTITLPNSKRIDIMKLLQSNLYQNKIWITKRELQSMLGKLVFASRAVKLGRTFYRGLIEVLRSYPADCSKNEQLEISKRMRKDMNWWLNLLINHTGVCVVPPSLSDYLPVDIHTMYVDACGTGYGGYYNGHEYVCQQWNNNDLRLAYRKRHISMPYLELLSLCHCCNIWKTSLAGKAIIINSDCMPVVNCINKGSSKDKGMMSLIRQLFYIAATHNILIHLQHIEGKKNIHADLLSRSVSEMCPEFAQFLKLLAPGTVPCRRIPLQFQSQIW
jgi:hypothetical protein